MAHQHTNVLIVSDFNRILQIYISNELLLLFFFFNQFIVFLSSTIFTFTDSMETGEKKQIFFLYGFEHSKIPLKNIHFEAS